MSIGPCENPRQRDRSRCQRFGGGHHDTYHTICLDWICTAPLNTSDDDGFMFRSVCTFRSVSCVGVINAANWTAGTFIASMPFASFSYTCQEVIILFIMIFLSINGARRRSPRTNERTTRRFPSKASNLCFDRSSRTNERIARHFPSRSSKLRFDKR